MRHGIMPDRSQDDECRDLPAFVSRAFFHLVSHFGATSMTKLFTTATKFAREEEGASLAEYGLLLALIALVCLAGMTILGTKINAMFSQISSTI